MSVTHVQNDTEFETFVATAKEQKTTVFIKFSAAWCGPCKQIQPDFERLAQTYQNCMFIHVDVDECQDAAGANEIMSLPTFLVIKEGVCVERLKGANKKKLDELVVKHAS